MDAPRLLAVMGSGETTATMAPVHRRLLERFPGRPRVAILDTPYGFQENADELTARAVDYFRASLPAAEVEVASLRSARERPLERERALDVLRRSDLVFSGPGSPSYALQVWAATPVPDILAAKLASGGALVMASAASITLGRFSLPVYEVYKVGADPFWLDGLDLLGAEGLPVVLVPHWNNAEGGTHDTSRCWMGLRRFEALAAQLPPGTTVIGIDEHTALIIDFAAGRAEVAGRGTVTLRAAGESATLGPGEGFLLDRLRGPAGAVDPAPTAGTPEAPAAVDYFEAAFAGAMEAADRNAALNAILALEDAHGHWKQEEAARAHSALRAMVTRLTLTLSDLAPTAAARREVVEALLEVRARAREDGRWADADAVRRALQALSVEVRDTPDGTVWEAGRT